MTFAATLTAHEHDEEQDRLAANQTPATDSERVERTRRVQHAHFDGDGNDLGPCILVSDLSDGPTEQWLSDGDAETEHTRVLAKGGAQDTGWLHAACSCGEYAWPCPHWLLAEHDRLTALLAEQAATIERARVVHYSPDMRRAPIVNPASEGWDHHDWHAAGVADTGASHVLVGRPYVVACEWCPEVFLAETAARAMSMFRAHESQMLGSQRTEGDRG